MSEMTAEQAWIAKELSWLSFNERVLQEAADPSVPIIQRIRYLGIFSNNLDEFFRVRVADVRRLAAFSTPSKQEDYKALMEEIHQKVLKLQRRFDATYSANLKELRRRKIYIVNERQLDEAVALRRMDVVPGAGHPEQYVTPAVGGCLASPHTHSM